MDQSLENKPNLKKRLSDFYILNKNIIYIFVIILITITATVLFINYKNEQKNVQMAEKYIKAGIYMSSNKRNDAKKLYEEILLSKNSFYSVLSLNTIIEKDLITDKKKILEYFTILETSITEKDQKDLIILKKSLYFFKILDVQKAEDLLNRLIKENSNLKPIAEEILRK